MLKKLACATIGVAILGLPGPALADPPQPPLPKPFVTPSVENYTNFAEWPAGQTPKVSGPFKVALWVDQLPRARWFLELPNGDILVAQSSAHRISLLRRSAGATPTVFPFIVSPTGGGDPKAPFGMALVGGDLYVAAADGLWRYAYQTGDTSISPASGVKILDLPLGGHNSRNVVASADGTKLFVSVGSGSNVDQGGTDALDPRRAAITEYDIASGKTRIFASGLRNPNGLAWNPVTGALWTAVNERDGLGDDLVPDFVTSLKPEGFYGWPYYYFGDYEEPRKAGERPDLAKKSLVPDLAVGAHTSSLGLAFYTGDAFPKRYRGGLFIGQHGSWNRSKPAGYRVAFVPFDENGRVAGPAQPFLTGFVADKDPLAAFGRPVGVYQLKDGSLLVADDAGPGRVWRVTSKGPDDGRPALDGVMLVDAEKDAPVFPLVDGITIKRKKIDVSKFNLIAAQAGPVGSVRFSLDGKLQRVENNPPFTVAPRKTVKGKVDYAAWTLPKGDHKLIATPFSGNDAKGKKGQPIVLRFRVE